MSDPKHMKAFLEELAELMVKHGVEMDVIESDYNYSTVVDGIEFTQNSVFNDSHDEVVPYSTAMVGKSVYPEDVSRSIENIKVGF